LIRKFYDIQQIADNFRCKFNCILRS